MNRNYETPTVDANWSDTRNTHPAVARAIHAIASGARTAEAIWEAPTPAEWANVEMAVCEYLDHGDFNRADDDRYPWGQENIVIEAR